MLYLQNWYYELTVHNVIQKVKLNNILMLCCAKKIENKNEMDQYENLQGRVSERADLLLLLLGQPRRALAAVVVAHDGDVPPDDGGGRRG